MSQSNAQVIDEMDTRHDDIGYYEPKTQAEINREKYNSTTVNPYEVGTFNHAWWESMYGGSEITKETNHDVLQHSLDRDMKERYETSPWKK